MDSDIVMFLTLPIIIFMIFVAPIWLIMHYRSKKQLNQGLSETDYAKLNDLARKAEKMAERIKTLEAILDEESPQWRAKG
ncbi:envelope stress response membrane protein PspB [Flocculibacter collagenilyticus]|uniref:envelope stress response membrane protein PspB n=1 Tax=Flocculibacter collagenilyticus TaxID=2744479 RepID=UPI0018F58017|nr:envelope stress response membrane protein PspB [Flocculibacter collagenilyticus]